MAEKAGVALVSGVLQADAMSGARRMPRLRRTGAVLGLLTALAGTVVAIASSMHGDKSSSMHGDTSTRLKLVFYDNFTGSRLNSSRWSTCYWWGTCTIATNHELEWYLPGQVQVGHGARLVAARRTVKGSNGRTYHFVSGMISSGPTSRSTTPKFAFRYGRVEARMQIDTGAGLWPAFWLLPANRGELPEIDIMEIHGQAPDVVTMHLHYRRPGGGGAVMDSSWTQPSLTRGWHEFGIDWSPGRLDWSIDGVVRWHVDGSAVPRQRMYLIVNLAVGGDPVGAPLASGPFPTALRIDWIKVWQ